MAKLDQAQLLAQQKSLRKQQSQFFAIVLAKIAYGKKIRPLPGRQKDKCIIVGNSISDLTGTENALGIGIEQNLKHHHRMVGRVSLRGRFFVRTR